MTLSAVLPRALGLIALALGVVFLTVASLFVGTRDIDPALIAQDLPRILRGVTAPLTLAPDLRVIAEQRIPRTCAGVLCGLCLGIAGALMQGHTKNPLADPGIMGVTHGAAFAVIVGTTFFALTSPLAVAACALSGALTATLVVFALANLGKRAVNPTTLILGGAALSAVMASLTTSIMISSSQALETMRRWQVGALTQADLSSVFWLGPVALCVVVVALSTAPKLNILSLGEDIARALGTNITLARVVGVFLIALLSALATALAGPIGFLGLIVPHMARAACGMDYRWILPYSALMGAVVLLLADIAGRMIVRPGEIEVGIVVALAGAPLFLLLLARRKAVVM